MNYMTEYPGLCSECRKYSLVDEHGHIRCTNPDCPKADLMGFVTVGGVRPQRG